MLFDLSILFSQLNLTCVSCHFVSCFSNDLPAIALPPLFSFLKAKQSETVSERGLRKMADCDEKKRQEDSISTPLVKSHHMVALGAGMRQSAAAQHFSSIHFGHGIKTIKRSQIGSNEKNLSPPLSCTCYLLLCTLTLHPLVF